MKLKNQLKLWEIPTKLKLVEFIALSISAAASTFGLYTILEPLITKQWQLFMLLFTFVGFFILIDRMRRGSLARFLNSQLSQLVESYMNGNIQLNGQTVKLTSTKTKWISGIVGVLFTVVIIGADIFGGYAIHATIKQELVEYKIGKNQTYQKEVTDIASGKTALESYNIAMGAWNTSRKSQLSKWENENKADKQKWEKKQKAGYASCDNSYSIAKYFFKLNRECKATWDKNNKYYNISKPSELMKPVLIASTDEKVATAVIGTGISSATIEAEKFAEPFARGFFMLYVVLSLILNGLVLGAIFDMYAEMHEDIESDPKLYKNSFEHWQIVRRAERHSISENKQKEEIETLNIRVNLSSKVTDLVIRGELRKAAIQLKQHQIIETGGYAGIINHLRGQGIKEEDIADLMAEFENGDDSPAANTTQQPAPIKIEQAPTEEQRVAKLDDDDRPIGFRAGDNINGSSPIQADAPTFKKSGYFDDGYDLTLAIYSLYYWGNIKSGEELLSNLELKELYDNSSLKRNELKINQISSLVKAPLKKDEVKAITAKIGFKDVAILSLDEVISKLELTNHAKIIEEELS